MSNSHDSKTVTIIDEHTRRQRARTCRHNVIYVIMFSHMIELAVMYFIVSEYIHHVLENEAYPNGTSNGNYSSCRETNHSDPGYTKYTHVQEETGKWTVYSGAAEYGMATLSNIFICSYTDTFGRKFSFLISVSGAIARAALVAGVVYFNIGLEFIILASGIYGLTGSSFSFFASTFLFFADVTVTTQQMMMAVTIAESIIGLVSTIGSLLSGILVDSIGYFIPSVACVCSSLFALILIIWVLPETLPPENRIKNPGVIKTMARSFEFYTSNEFKGQRLAYMFLITSFFFIELIGNNRGGIETVYLLGMPFCWQPHDIGYFTSLRFGVQALGGVLVLKLVRRCVSNDVLALASAVANGGTLVLEGVARHVVTLYLVAIPSVISFLCIPLIRGTMSSMTSPQKQGSLFSSLATVEVASALAATLSENSIYSATVAVSNSFVFYVMAGFSGITAVFLCLYMVVKPRPGYDVIQDVNPDGEAIQTES